ncbi:alpha/beta hydrolase fold domain-containing protein [Cohnella sp.]|uniref:CBM96 family carbohydrate-binding protein n=1 Tax=Cohnella sp. TaxID=1883426 RepID=UPI003567E506
MSLTRRSNFKVFMIFLCVCLGGIGPFPSHAPNLYAAEGAAWTIFSDGMETLDNWLQEGGASQAGLSPTRYAGEHSAKLDNTDALRLSISTEGYEDIRFGFYYKTGSNYAGQLAVQFSTDGGTQWQNLEVIQSPLGTFMKKQFDLPAIAGNLADLRLRFAANSGSHAVYIDEVEVNGRPVSGPVEPIPDPEGPELEIYAETFDDPDVFGSGGGVTVPPPWIQEGSGGSAARTSASASAPSVPNMVKIDGADALALPMNLAGYGNISVRYYTRASSYSSGSIVVEWSGNGGADWTSLEEFKLPAGTTSQGNTLKSWSLDSSANNNPNIKIRFRVGETMMGNMYVDSFSVSGQRIPGIEPAPTPVPIPDPVETPPFVPPAGVTLYEDVEIGMAGGRKLYTSIAVPETPPNEPMPVVVYIHGGGWNHGDRKSALPAICNYVAKGYIGVTLSYRLTPEAPYPAQIQDVKLAIRYLRANAEQYHIDPSRIGVWGSSAGGHLAALLGTTADLPAGQPILLDNGNTVPVPDLEGTGGYPEYSTRVQAVVDWFGPADFTTEFANGNGSVTKLLGGHPALSVPNEARLAMPGTYASSDDPPFWIRHGTADGTVPYDQSIVLKNQLTAGGVQPVDFQLVEGQGHGFTGVAKTIATAEAWAFLDQHVKNRVVTEPIVYKPGYGPNPNPDPEPSPDPEPDPDPNPEPPQKIVTEVATLMPTDDAAIDSTAANAGTNFNEKTGSSVGLFSISSDSSKSKIVYFKYDITSASSADYTYKMYVSAKTGSSGLGVELSVFGLDDLSWSETELTWNNAPVTSLDPTALIGSFTVDSGTTRLYEVDVTDYIQSRIAQGRSQVAFIVGDAGQSGISVNVYSKETTSSSNPKPRLVVSEEIDYGNDSDPPIWPEGGKLSAANLGTDFVELSWPQAADNTVVAHYRIYRDGVLQGTTDTGSYRVQELTPATAYTFTVTAIDVAGNVSQPLTLERASLAAPIEPLPVVDVVASGSDGNPEFNTLDNNLYTRWSAAGAGQWIRFDLGEIRRIGYVGIAFYKGDMRTTSIRIETSSDGSVWTAGFEGSSNGRTTAMQPFDIPDADARYVRITGYGNSDGSVFTSLTAVHLYPPFAHGDTPVALIPYTEPGRPDGAVPFTQPGMREADGTVRPLHTPNPVTGRSINVLDYGADPLDNNQDDRPAIQAAIQAAEAGDEVYLPNGVYNLLSAPDGVTNLALKSGVNLRGESETGTILKTSLDKVRNSAALKASRQHDLVISDLTLTSTWDGEYSTDHRNNNPAAGGPDSQIVIANFGEDPSYRITVERVTVEKYMRMGVRIDNSRDIVIRNSAFRNATDVGGGGAGYGVSIQGIAKVDRLGYANDTIWNVVENSVFEGPYLRHGVLIQFVAHNNVVRNNRFDRIKLDAIDLHGELEYLNEIYGNLITNILTGGGIGLGNTGGTAPSNHSKSGPGNYIHDNIIRNSREGIAVTMGTPDTVIERNRIELTDQVEGASGILVMNGPGTIIRGNSILNNTAADFWGILLKRDPGDQNANNVGAGDPHQVRIERNTIIDNTNGIQIAAGTEIVLRGNVLNNTGLNYHQSEGTSVTIEELSANADLEQLSIVPGELNPAFAPSISSYTVRVARGVSSLELAFRTAHPEARVRIGGEAADGIYMASLPMGKSAIAIEVTAENGDTKTYMITVIRAAGDKGKGCGQGNGNGCGNA